MRFAYLRHSEVASGKHAFDWPASTQARLDRDALEAGSPCPIAHGLRLATKYQYAVVALVVLLLVLSSPTDVSGFVVSVGIDSVDGVSFGRPRPHVSHEGWKGLTPFWAHCNPAPPPILVVRSLGVEASRLDTHPTQELWPIALAVCPIGRHHLGEFAAAGSGLTALQRRVAGVDRLPTRAAADRPRLPVSRGSDSFNAEFATNKSNWQAQGWTTHMYLNNTAAHIETRTSGEGR